MRTIPLLVLLLNGIVLCTCCSLATRCGGRLAAPDLRFVPDELPEAVQGEPYTATITVVENDTPVGDFWVRGELPPGLSLTVLDGTDSAEIAGTPEAAGTYTFTVAAWCYGTNVNGDEGEQAYTLVVR